MSSTAAVETRYCLNDPTYPKSIDDRAAAIKAKLDILAVAGRYTPLEKVSWRDYVGLCPFHGELTPSFVVDTKNNRFHCFGCGEGGGVFRFIMRKEGLTLSEALSFLEDF